ncbi:hypothetical protein [Bosea sp. 124]|nr:hypothetical protein [Bosea sp. 124]PTM39903.1 hypothetical protein C8D03_1413 [Bosea sp. 124]
MTQAARRRHARNGGGETQAAQGDDVRQEKRGQWRPVGDPTLFPL